MMWSVRPPRSLWKDTQGLLQQHDRRAMDQGEGRRGFLAGEPVDGDDVDRVGRMSRGRPSVARFFTLRQQMEKTNDKGQLALSDFHGAKSGPTMLVALLSRQGMASWRRRRSSSTRATTIHRSS
jgi:cobalamin-dependent methionine synthase I